MAKRYQSIFKDLIEPEVELIGALTCTVVDIEGYIVFIYTDRKSREYQRLQEANLPGKTLLGKKYSANKHAAHTPEGQQHLHIYAGQKQIFALNIDGTAHDASHQTQIPGVVAKGIRKVFPDWTIPPDRYIETVTLSEVRRRLHG